MNPAHTNGPPSRTQHFPLDARLPPFRFISISEPRQGVYLDGGMLSGADDGEDEGEGGLPDLERAVASPASPAAIVLFQLGIY